jgi:hypothetical protein
MAANDYYASAGQQQQHHRADAPLPPVPGNHSIQSQSPVTSPFDDRSQYGYPPTHNSSQVPLTGYDSQNDTAYHGHNTSHSADPFADQNAIPLQHGNMDPEGRKRYTNDPEARYPQGHAMRDQKKKKGWFSGRVTWVVYILTTVQIAVFIGEVIKMGMFYFCSHYCWCSTKQVGYTDNQPRHANRLPHPNKTNFQLPHRSF